MLLQRRVGCSEKFAHIFFELTIQPYQKHNFLWIMDVNEEFGPSLKINKPHLLGIRPIFIH